MALAKRIFLLDLNTVFTRPEQLGRNDAEGLMPGSATLPLRRSPPRAAAPRQSMRIAAIDVGSNSIHMIVAEADVDGGIHTLVRLKGTIRLGRGRISRPHNP